MNSYQKLLKYNPDALLVRLGLRIEAAKDPRNADFPLKAMITPDAVTPSTIIKRGQPISLRKRRYWNVKKILDQGQTGSCVGHANAAVVLNGPVTQTKAAQALADPFKIYDIARDLDEIPGNDYEGTTTLGGMKAIRELGFIESFYWGKTLEDAKWYVKEVGPFPVGTWWYYDDFFLNKTDQFIKLTGGKAGGHEWTIIGYDDDRAAFRCQQSWGLGYGFNGRFWIKDKQFMELQEDEGDMAMPKEIRKL